MLQRTGTVRLHKCCHTCVSAAGLELCMLLLHSCPPAPWQHLPGFPISLLLPHVHHLACSLSCLQD